MSDKTQYQMIADVWNLTGFKIQLNLFDSVEKVIISDTKVVVKMRVHEVEERRFELHVKKAGTRLIEYSNATGAWRRSDTMTVWDEEKPADYLTVRAPITPEDYYGKVEWEQMCYRPGNAAFPLDNYYSVDTPRMERHWMGRNESRRTE